MIFTKSQLPFFIWWQKQAYIKQLPAEISGFHQHDFTKQQHI